MAAIARFGTRMVPELERIIRECREQKQLVQGPHIAAFEDEYARFLGGGHVRAVSTEYGRMGLYFILKALDLPPGSEIIVPALTFWVVPEITRVAGLTPVFADIDPATFTMRPEAAERAITPKTRAILPTHLYGMACDLDPIVALAKRHNLKIVEDCAHSLGAQYKGRMVGTHGDAAFFSFQAFKPLNTFGGGLTWVRDASVAKRVSEFAEAEEWPTGKRVEEILRIGYWQYTFIRPKVFTWSLFPIWWAASFTDWKPEKRLWEEVRRLDPLPAHYRGRFSNVQAGIGRAGLARLPEYIERTRRHAKTLNEMLGDLPGVTVPSIPEGRTHVYYQYCAYVPDSVDLVRRCIRRGVDVAPMHVDDCTKMPLFGWQGPPAPGAAKAMTAVQVPVYESLSDAEIERIGRLVRAQVLKTRSTPASVSASTA
ncbi:MAG TPA: aminotransferase class I/II-fold pyridoxal phosphate-dependent enzyme [Vicinamibacterales bacterium]|nr:aminotransferase class I/II-fold pyridoxal phosphate-dependent enzyme [Vicinamibacterales bacterium]